MSFLKLLEKFIDSVFAFLPRKAPKNLKITDVRLIAHRGAHNKRIIENTDAAFAKAQALGCWGIEFDVHATADGVLVVNHDPTLIRLWNKHSAIKELSFGELRQLVPGILSLAEVVERYGKRLHLLIELKAPFSAETNLYDDLRTLTPCVDYHLLSLDEPVFASLTSFSREVMLLVPIHNNVNRFLDLCLQKNYGGILGHYLLLSNRKIRRLQSTKKTVGIGMVNSKFGLYREINRGVPWIFSNNVTLLAKVLKKLTTYPHH